MNKLPVLSFFLLSVCLVGSPCFSSALSIAHEHQTSSTGSNKSSPQTVQFNFSKYKGSSPNVKALFKDRQITSALSQLLKKDYQKLIDNMENVDITDPLVDNNGILTVSGGVPHAYTIAEGMFIIEPRGNIYAAILEDGDRVLYFTNDTNFKDKLPPAIELWRERFKEVPVIFKSK